MSPEPELRIQEWARCITETSPGLVTCLELVWTVFANI